MTSRRPAVQRHSDRGQTSSDFLGMIVVVAAIVGVLTSAGLGTLLLSQIEAAICRIAGGTCSVAAISHVPPSECEVSSHSVAVTGDVVVFSVDLGASGNLTLSKAVDPSGKAHWYVQQEGEGRIGADVSFGEEAGLGDLGEGVNADVKAFLRGGAGMKMEFATQKAARDFMTAAEHEPIKRALTGWDPTGLTHWLADKADGHHYNPPKPTEYFFDGGAKVEGSLDAKAGVGSVGAEASGSAVVGVKFMPNPDGSTNKTVYLKVSADAEAKLGVFEAVEGKAGAGGEAVVGIEYDGQGRAKTATLDLAGNLKAQLGPNGEVGGEQTITDLAGKAVKGAPELGNSIGGGATGKLGFTIDLTQGDNRNVVADGLHSLGIPVLQGDGSTNTPGPVDGVKGIYNLFDSGAPGNYLTRTTYATSTNDTKGKLKGGDADTFGVEGGLTFEDQKITGGAYYQPGQGFVPWTACAG
jgi:hypothetical protein